MQTRIIPKSFFSFDSPVGKPPCMRRPCSMFRPQRTTVFLAIAAEPAEKPDARFLALDRNSAPTPVSQPLSLNHRRPSLAFVFFAVECLEVLGECYRRRERQHMT